MCDGSQTEGAEKWRLTQPVSVPWQGEALIIMIISFPIKQKLYPSSTGATKTDIIVGRIKECLGRTLLRTGIPAMLSDCSINDELTGQQIDIQSGVLFTRVSINGRDYFFDRFTGKYSGTGTGCS